MNVVGRVGNLITQGVYTVATPFHPFGGAVDVIVVQQPDGSFRSNPWYVRFGKFQGVLKGSEKFVRIAVNGVEADFHMYLDNSGEAYFVKEIVPEFVSVKGDFGSGENVRRLEHSVSDSAVDELHEERDESGLERAESDGERSFYEFQDDDSVELSESSQDLDSEVVLVSVDGHILTAPITADERKNNKFGSGENGWAVDLIGKVNGSDSSLDIRVNSDSVEDIAGLEGLSLSSEAHCNGDDVSPLSVSVSLDNTVISMDEQRNNDKENWDVAESNVFDNHEDSERESNEQIEIGVSEPPVASEASEVPMEKEEEEEEEGTATTSMSTHSNTGFEISLCGNKLQPGMGSEAASKAFEASRVSAEEFKASAASILKNGNLVVQYKGQYFPWEKVAHIALGIVAFGLDEHPEEKDAIPVEEEQSSKNNDDSTPSGRRWRIWSIPFRRVKTLERNLSNEDDEFVDSESVLVESQNEESPRKQLVRTNVPSSEQIASLNLKEGQNIVTFSFSTRVLGRQQVEAHMYLWKWNARIVISDVDGTITKSDVLGQFMPLVGKDWSQSGVAKLFSAIKENGYQLLFLSARAIVQAYLTRSFLLNLKQDGSSLPDGPVVISPDGLFPSLYREVIRRAPHEFKIACLEDIKKLFPSDYNPFYAGFGNRDTDELSYRKMGIPKGKIFIINPKGEVAISHRIDVKSYTSLHTLVNDMFPPTSLVEQEDYNSWNFWKVPLPEVEE